MTNALETFGGSVEFDGRAISNLRFADDIDLIARSKEELKELTERFDKTARTCGKEISAEKSKTMFTSRINEDDEKRLK